jgi:transcriptional regulator with XRE-family HTH domain
VSRVAAENPGTRATEDAEARLRRFGEALAEARQARGVSQTGMGRLLGRTSQSTVSGWELGVAEPSPLVVFAIEKALKLDPGFLSRHLGYAPVVEAAEPAPAYDLVKAVVQHPTLDSFTKDILLAIVNRALEFAEETQKPEEARSRRRRPRSDPGSD